MLHNILGVLWVWSGIVTNGWVCTTGVVAGFVNIKDISTCSVAMVGACATASASLTWPSQFCCKGAG